MPLKNSYLLYEVFGSFILEIVVLVLYIPYLSQIWGDCGRKSNHGEPVVEGQEKAFL